MKRRAVPALAALAVLVALLHGWLIERIAGAASAPRAPEAETVRPVRPVQAVLAQAAPDAPNAPPVAALPAAARPTVEPPAPPAVLSSFVAAPTAAAPKAAPAPDKAAAPDKVAPDKVASRKASPELPVAAAPASVPALAPMPKRKLVAETATPVPDRGVAMAAAPVAALEPAVPPDDAASAPQVAQHDGHSAAPPDQATPGPPMDGVLRLADADADADADAAPRLDAAVQTAAAAPAAIPAGRAAPADPAPPPPTYRTRIPPAARLSYRLSRSGVVGSGELDWQPQARSYSLRLEGSVPLLGTLITQTSRGAFDAAGLAPERHTDRRLRRGEQAVNFQRDKGLISFSGPSTELALHAGVQDRLSVMLQLAAIANAWRKPPAVGTQVLIQVVGARGDAHVWSLRYEGPQAVETPAGSVQAARFVREPARPYDIRAEFWLDGALSYLPVRVRLTDARGGALELLRETRVP